MKVVVVVVDAVVDGNGFRKIAVTRSQSGLVVFEVIVELAAWWASRRMYGVTVISQENDRVGCTNGRIHQHH